MKCDRSVNIRVNNAQGKSPIHLTLRPRAKKYFAFKNSMIGDVELI